MLIWWSLGVPRCWFKKQSRPTWWFLQFWMQAVWLFAFLFHVQNSYLPCRPCLWSNNPMFLDWFTGRLPAERPVPRGLEWPCQQDEDKWNTFPAILQVCIYHSFCLPASPPPPPNYLYITSSVILRCMPPCRFHMWQVVQQFTLINVLSFIHGPEDSTWQCNQILPWKSQHSAQCCMQCY